MNTARATSIATANFCISTKSILGIDWSPVQQMLMLTFVEKNILQVFRRPEHSPTAAPSQAAQVMHRQHSPPHVSDKRLLDIDRQLTFTQHVPKDFYADTDAIEASPPKASHRIPSQARPRLLSTASLDQQR